MKIFLFILALFVGSAVSALGQAAPAKVQTNTLTVVNEEGKSFEFTATDLAKLARQQVKAKDHEGKEIAFEGVSVADVLKLAGVKLGGDTMRGKRLANYLLVEAKDNYKAVFSLTEFDPEYTNNVILLADKADGKALDEKNGPWQIIVPNQNKHGRWVREVIKLTVKMAEPTVELTRGDSNDEEAIYETVFRNMLKGWYGRTAKPTENYYLEIKGKKDPSDALMQKLSDLGTQLKKGSESFISDEEGSIVLDKKTKKQGVLFIIYKFEWINKNEARVQAGDHQGNMGSSSCTYKVERENGKWNVVGATSCVIS